MESKFTDQQIVCTDCSESFTFTAEDQEKYEARNFDPPKRCRPCRMERKQRRRRPSSGPRRRPPRPMTPITCDACGQESEVPFEPKEDRPVYCPDCYKSQRDDQGGNRRGGGRGSYDDDRRDGPPADVSHDAGAEGGGDYGD